MNVLTREQKKASTTSVDAQNSGGGISRILSLANCKLQAAIIHLGILLLGSSSDLEKVPLRKTAGTFFLLQMGFASPWYY